MDKCLHTRPYSLVVESGSFLHKMPDLPIVGQPERTVRARDDAPQVPHVKRATPVVEVSVGREKGRT